MSNLKFRVWDGEEMLYSEMAAGPTRWIRLQSFFDACDFFGAKEDEVMQYTDLTDAEGEEVYEGDIIAWPSEETKALIKWKEAYSGFRAMTLDGVDSLMLGLQFDKKAQAVVVGNKHEDPELLKVIQ